METIHFHIAHTRDFLRTTSFQLEPYLNDLFVGEFCEMFSDVHSPVTLTLDFKLQCAYKHNITSDTRSPQLNLWQQVKAELFVNNLDIDKLNSLNETILQCQENKHITQTDLDTLVENFNDIIFENAETSFGYKMQSYDVFSCFCHFPIGQVRYLIISIPDLCLLSSFYTKYFLIKMLKAFKALKSAQ